MNGWGMKLDARIKLRALEKINDPSAMAAIGKAAIAIIRDETQDQNIDQNSKPFKRYNKDYARLKTTKFKARNTNVNLTLTGKMLFNMTTTSFGPSFVEIGFIDSSPISGGLKPSQKMILTNRARPWFGFGQKNSRRRKEIERVGREIYLRALTREDRGSN